MNTPPPTGRGHGDALRLLLLLALCGVVFFAGLGERALWDVDEGMHAATSRAIVESGDWILPTFNGKPFLDKPILHNWLVSISFCALGMTEYAARLPSAVLGVGVVLLGWLLGRRMFGGKVGFLGAAVLATSMLHVLMSRVVVHDICLAFFVTMALCAFHAAYRAPRPRGLALWAFWIAIGFAFLAKGPVGPVLVGLPIACTVYRDRRWRVIGEFRPFVGALVALAILLPWNVLMMLRSPDYGLWFFLRKNVLGFLTGDTGHMEPPLFYVPVLLVGLLPWTAFTLVAGRRAFLESAGPRRDELVFLLTWFLSGFTFFTLATSKLPTYVLPIVPPAALLVGWCWNEVAAAPTDGLRRAFRIASWPLLVVFGGAAVVFWTFPPERLHEKLGLDLRDLALLLTGLTTLAAVAFAAVRRDRFRLAFVAHIGMAVVILLSFAFVLGPQIGPYRSSRELSGALDRELPAGAPIVMFRGVRDSAVYYTGRLQRELVTHERFLDYMKSPERVLCIVSSDDREEIAAIAPDLFVVADYGQTFVLSNVDRAVPLLDGSAPTPVRLGAW